MAAGTANGDSDIITISKAGSREIFML